MGVVSLGSSGQRGGEGLCHHCSAALAAGTISRTETASPLHSIWPPARDHQRRWLQATKILILGIFWSNESGFQAVFFWKSVGPSSQLIGPQLARTEAWRFRRNFLRGSLGSWPLVHPELLFQTWVPWWLPRVVWIDVLSCPKGIRGDVFTSSTSLLPDIARDKCSMLHSIGIHIKHVRNHGSIGWHPSCCCKPIPNLQLQGLTV